MRKPRFPPRVFDPPAGLPAFVAIDFETASNDPAEVCAFGLVRVDNGVVVAERKRLVRPLHPIAPAHQAIHGISDAMVATAAPFAEAWEEDAAPLLRGAHFLAAHNAPFDQRVLRAALERSGQRPPNLRFICTLALARAHLALHSHALPVVAAHLGIPLRHHDPLADAKAAAQIVLLLDRRRRDEARSSPIAGEMR